MAEPEYMHPDDSLGPQRCDVCEKLTGWKLCGACKVVSYCCVAHQSRVRPSHKTRCTKVKKARERLEHEEAKLRSQAPDIFTEGVGRFWGIVETRDYMRAIYSTADAMLAFDTRVAVEKALDHFLDMCRLCRGDNLGIRYIIPALFLRLGREQECYDFLNWWTTTGGRSDYDWGDPEEPYLDIRGADVLEDIEIFNKDSDVFALVPLTLLKLRLLNSLRMFENLERLDDPIDPDYKFENDFPDPGSLARDVLRRKDVDFWTTIEKLQTQYLMLLRRVQEENPWFWPMLIKEEDPKTPPMYSPGTKEEAMLLMCYNNKVWHESGSGDCLRTVLADTTRMAPVYSGSSGPNATLAFSPLLSLDFTQWDNANNIAPQTVKLDIRRGTGKVFPSTFTPPSPTCKPKEEFPLSLLPTKQVSRFVHIVDRKKGLVYIHGACVGMDTNRTIHEDIIPSWAVVFDNRGKNSPLSGQLENRGPFGEKHEVTSSRAELRAAIAALRRTLWREEGFECLVIATSSAYVIGGATEGARSWFHSDWTSTNGHPVKDKDLWEVLLGEVERWEEKGLKIEFWKIPDESNSDALAATDSAAGRGVAEPRFTDVCTTPGHFGLESQRTKVIHVDLDNNGFLEKHHPELCSVIRERGDLYHLNSFKLSLTLLNTFYVPSAVIITDWSISSGSITNQTLMYVTRLLRGGGTVILAGAFSSSLKASQFELFFGEMELDWELGSNHRATVKLRPENVPPHLHSSLPAEGNQQLQFVKNVDKSSIWYAESDDSSEGAVLFASVGKGKLGYIGDSSGSEAAKIVLQAMCTHAFALVD
ncbi:hypothetical protein E8E14_005546 [Neopestalotiopsis sp. 37M]|nr:hypothetical protein E8E14_005546 [Neopestalotiopsis sp. 37M]